MNIWSFFDLLVPCCLVCGLSAGRRLPLCTGCAADLPRLPATCSDCGLPLAPGQGAASSCSSCRQRPPAVRCLAACAYAFPVDRLIQDLKFAGRQPAARVLGQLLAGAAQAQRSEQPLPQALLPVPLHPARRRQRGYNQAELLARVAGRSLGIPVLPHALQRIRDTPAQSRLDLAARRANLHAAFTVCAPLPAHVAIVDDVITTGSTVGALADCLAAAGCNRIEAWAVARTL